MTNMHSVAHGGTAGFGTDTTAASGGRSAAASGGRPATPAAADDGSTISIELLPAYGVRATFSPRSLEVLQQAALDVVGDAGDLVEHIGDSAVAIIESAQALMQGVAETVSETVGDSAQALLASGEAAQSGVQQLAREAEALVSQSLSRAGDAAGAALGYGAVATLAGQALLSTLA